MKLKKIMVDKHEDVNVHALIGGKRKNPKRNSPSKSTQVALYKDRLSDVSVAYFRTIWDLELIKLVTQLLVDPKSQRVPPFIQTIHKAIRNTKNQYETGNMSVIHLRESFWTQLDTSFDQKRDLTLLSKSFSDTSESTNISVVNAQSLKDSSEKHIRVVARFVEKFLKTNHKSTKIVDVDDKVGALFEKIVTGLFNTCVWGVESLCQKVPSSMNEDAENKLRLFFTGEFSGGVTTFFGALLKLFTQYTQGQIEGIKGSKGTPKKVNDKILADYRFIWTKLQTQFRLSWDAQGVDRLDSDVKSWDSDVRSFIMHIYHLVKGNTDKRSQDEDDTHQELRFDSETTEPSQDTSDTTLKSESSLSFENPNTDEDDDGGPEQEEPYEVSIKRLEEFRQDSLEFNYVCWNLEMLRFLLRLRGLRSHLSPNDGVPSYIQTYMDQAHDAYLGSSPQYPHQEIDEIWKSLSQDYHHHQDSSSSIPISNDSAMKFREKITLITKSITKFLLEKETTDFHLRAQNGNAWDSLCSKVGDHYGDMFDKLHKLSGVSIFMLHGLVKFNQFHLAMRTHKPSDAMHIIQKEKEKLSKQIHKLFTTVVTSLIDEAFTAYTKPPNPLLPVYSNTFLKDWTLGAQYSSAEGSLREALPLFVKLFYSLVVKLHEVVFSLNFLIKNSNDVESYLNTITSISQEWDLRLNSGENKKTFKEPIELVLKTLDRLDSSGAQPTPDIVSGSVPQPSVSFESGESSSSIHTLSSTPPKNQFNPTAMDLGDVMSLDDIIRNIETPFREDPLKDAKDLLEHLKSLREESRSYVELLTKLYWMEIASRIKDNSMDFSDNKFSMTTQDVQNTIQSAKKVFLEIKFQYTHPKHTLDATPWPSFREELWKRLRGDLEEDKVPNVPNLSDIENMALSSIFNHIKNVSNDTDNWIWNHHRKIHGSISRIFLHYVDCLFDVHSYKLMFPDPHYMEYLPETGLNGLKKFIATHITDALGNTLDLISEISNTLDTNNDQLIERWKNNMSEVLRHCGIYIHTLVETLEPQLEKLHTQYINLWQSFRNYVMSASENGDEEENLQDQSPEAQPSEKKEETPSKSDIENQWSAFEHLLNNPFDGSSDFDYTEETPEKTQKAREDLCVQAHTAMLLWSVLEKFSEDITENTEMDAGWPFGSEKLEESTDSKKLEEVEELEKLEEVKKEGPSEESEEDEKSEGIAEEDESKEPKEEEELEEFKVDEESEKSKKDEESEEPSILQKTWRKIPFFG